MTLKKVFLSFLSWRVLITLVAFAGMHYLEYKPTFANPEYLDLFQLPRIISSWANFDGVHYLTIAREGYDASHLISAFFPVFPLFIRIVSVLPGSTLFWGLMISHIAFISTLLIWTKFFNEMYSNKVVVLSTLLLLAFPTSFFFGSVYSESLFLLLVLSSLYVAYKGNFLLSGLLAAGATANRIVGIWLIVALGFELLEQQGIFSQKVNRDKVKKLIQQQWIQFAKISLGLSGLFGYMIYLGDKYSDPLKFYHVQSEFGSGREESLVLLPQVVWRYLKILVTANPQSFAYYAAAQELIISLIVLGVLIMAYKYRTKANIRLSWLVFSAGAYITPTLTGTLSSMPRYVLVCFPVFLLAGWFLSDKPRLFLPLFLISVVFLIINTMLFIQGYWVA